VGDPQFHSCIAQKWMLSLAMGGGDDLEPNAFAAVEASIASLKS
jgi:hypothetical protein